MAEYESFIASIQEKEQKWDNRLKPSSQKQPTTVSLARFNPNIADSVILPTGTARMDGAEHTPLP